MTSISVARVVAPRGDLDVVVVADRRGGEPDRVEQLRDARRAQVGAEEPGHASRAHAHRRAFRAGCRWRPRRPSSSGAPSSSANRRMARSMTSGSVPFSKRAEASERSLWRRDDFTMPIGWNQAISSSTSVVASSISVVAPPMIPARPTGTSSPSQMSRSSGVRRRSTSSRVVSVSPSRADAHPEPGPGDLGQVVGVVRLAQLEHDVVRHVDDVVDRPHARAARGGRPASGRRARP